jgi:L-asparaginase II
MQAQPYIPLVEVTRGPLVECVHSGAFAVCDADGCLLHHGGDAGQVTFLRSSAKPFQCLPLVEAGGVEKFNLSERELAILCASHHGTDEHVRVISGILQRLGLSESDLMCGMQPPEDSNVARRMIKNDEPNSPLRHNCSGKHTGMLAQCILRGLPTADYLNPAHPVQVTILETFAQLTDVPVAEIPLGTDGCSAPVFAVPLKNAAMAFARLADPSALAETRRSALGKIFKAMTTNPDMVAAPGAFDTRLMEVGHGMILTKGGAEGYQAVALLPGACGKGSPALGITLKIGDGDRLNRARPTATLSLLHQLGALDDAQLAELADFGDRLQYNWRHIPVGEIRATLQL